MSLADFMQHYAYAGLALGSVLEGETVVALAGIAARNGYLSLLWVVAVAAAGALVIDAVAFTVGRLCGPRLIARSKRLAAIRVRVQALLERHNAMPVVGLRFAYGLRIAGTMALGMSGMSWLRFASLSVIGACCWALLVASGGYLQAHVERAVFDDTCNDRTSAGADSCLLARSFGRSEDLVADSGWERTDHSGMNKRVGSLRAIALVELSKGVLVLLAAGLIVGLLHSDLQSLAEMLVRHFHMNPARHHPQVFVETLRNFADAHKLVLSLGAICYAAVRFVEAYGLWLARRWAWGFGILSGGLYIPLELVELSKKVSWVGVTVLIVNICIVIALWYSKADTR